MVQKYSRVITITYICILLICLWAGSTLAESRTAPWLQNLLPDNLLHMLNIPTDTNKSDEHSLSPHYKLYAALGDSVADGSGLSALPHPTEADYLCERSGQAYPAVLSRRIHAKLIYAACGGAATNHLIETQTLGTGSNRPQLDQAYATDKPDLFTITLGANDVRWIQAMIGCYTEDCTQTTNTSSIDRSLTELKMKLYYDIHEINRRSGKPLPRIVLTGYYTFGSPACLTSLAPEQITSAEVIWFNQQTSKLNETIKATARQFANARYAAIDSNSHGLCASGNQRWVQNLNESSPFHLTASGEKALADAAYSQTVE